MVMSRINFNFFAELGRTNVNGVRPLTILDTCAGVNFIRNYMLPIGYDTSLKYGPPNISDANGNCIDMHGLLNLQVELGGYILSLDIIIYKRLEASYILCTNFSTASSKPSVQN